MFYSIQNGLLLGGIQCKGDGCDCILFFIHSGATVCGVAIFLCEKLPLNGCQLVLVIHRLRTAIDT